MSQTAWKIREAERKAPMHFAVREAPEFACIRCGHPVYVMRTIETRDGEVVGNVVTLSVVCEECWLKEPACSQ